jgi:flagellar protein FliO/FliZ
MTQNAIPALVLLAVLVGIAWALKWARGRVPGLGAGAGPSLRILSSLALGPQQRVVTVEVGDGERRIGLVLGVAPGSVQTLHTLELPPAPPAAATPPAPGGFAARLAQQLVKPTHEPR